MKKLLLAVLLLMGVTGAMAQQVYNSSGKANYKKKKHTGYDPDKLVLGGGINLGIGSGYASLGVSPIAGYRVGKHWFAGVGLGYQYLQMPDKIDQYNNILLSFQNIVYPSAWTRVFVYRNIYAVGIYEYDIINKKSSEMNVFTSEFEPVKQNISNQCLFVGVGTKQSLGGRVSLYMELVYDVIQGKNSPYPTGSPNIRVGLAIGM